MIKYFKIASDPEKKLKTKSEKLGNIEEKLVTLLVSGFTVYIIFFEFPCIYLYKHEYITPEQYDLCLHATHYRYRFTLLISSHLIIAFFSVLYLYKVYKAGQKRLVISCLFFYVFLIIIYFISQFHLF